MLQLIVIADYLFGAGSLECHRDRRRRLQRERQQNRMDVDSEEDESVEDGSALFDNTSDNGNDFVGGDESDTEEDSESSSSSIASGNLAESNESSSSRISIVQRRTRARSMESALGQLSLQEDCTSIAQRTRSCSNGEEPMAFPCETRSRSRGPTRDSASTSTPIAQRTRRSLSRGRTENRDSSNSSSTPIAQRTRRSLSRGRTENDEGGSSVSSSTPFAQRTRRSLSRGRTENRDNALSSTPVAQRTRRSLSRGRTENEGGSASTSTPVARRSQQITSPLLSPIPIEKDSRRVQEEVDTTLDTVNLTDVSDETVQYEDEEVSSSTSPSRAMVLEPSHKYDSIRPRSLKAILESLDVTIEELRLKYPLLYHVLTTFDSKEIGPVIEGARAANAQNAQGLSDAAAAVDEEEDEASVDEEENDYSPGSTINGEKLDNLPQDCAVLGLQSHLSKAMDENPKTEGHAFFLELIAENYERFQLAKPNTNCTRGDVVQVSTAIITI